MTGGEGLSRAVRELEGLGLVERTLQQQDIYGARGGKADRIQASAIVRF